MQPLKTLTSRSRKGSGALLKGALFTPFNGSCEKLPRHELDTEVEAYYSVLDQVVIPTLQLTSPNQREFKKRISEVVNYSASVFNDTWNFGVELTYRKLAPREHQTPENIKKARLLRAAMDLTFGMVALLDDVTDKVTRQRKQAVWYSRCPGGKSGAIYDGALLGYYATYLVKTHFRSDPGYALLLELVNEASMNCKIGQILDFDQHNKNSSIETFFGVASYKGGDALAPMGALGAIHAGVLDEEILKKFKAIFFQFGLNAQILGDFESYYQDSGKTYDFYNAGTTWVNSTALKHFNERQKQIYEECFGQKDPEKLEALKKLYDEVDVPRLYIEYMRKSYEKISEEIENLPEQKFKDPCISYMEWLMRDVCDPHYKNTKERLGL